MGIVGLCGRYGLLVSLCVAYFLFFFKFLCRKGYGRGGGDVSFLCIYLDLFVTKEVLKKRTVHF